MIGISPFFIILQVKFNIVVKYYEVTFYINPYSELSKDIMIAMAADTGFESFEDNDHGFTGYVQIDKFDKIALDGSIESFPIPDTSIKYDISKPEDRNWNEKWEKAGFEPIIIDQRCIIYDAKQKYPDCHYPLSIAIDAQQAFGTGTHETTQMIVSAILNMNMDNKRVLDCGCGTGILGIVSAKKGAKEVIGYDIDDWSTKNAVHNAEINKVNMEIFEGDKNVLSHICGVFDVILANINRNILLSDMQAFTGIMNNSCTLVISGFHEKDAIMLTRKAASLGLKETKRQVINNWCCLVFEKQLYKRADRLQC